MTQTHIMKWDGKCKPKTTMMVVVKSETTGVSNRLPVVRILCALTEWCDRDAMVVFFIRIPRNLNYVFVAIKMKYYKFNNRNEFGVSLFLCLWFLVSFYAAEITTKPAKRIHSHTHHFYRIYRNSLFGLANGSARLLSGFWFLTKAAAQQQQRKRIYDASRVCWIAEHDALKSRIN